MAHKHLQTIGQGLILIAIMLAAIAAALWLRPSAVESAAHARALATDANQKAFPDPGTQRLDILTELRSMNARMEKIEGGLRSGEFQVQALEPKTPEGGARTEK